MNNDPKKIVVIGGGTGTYTVLSGLAQFKQLELTSVVTMVDDGGSNRVLRDEFGLLPTSGIRQSIVALAKQNTSLRELFAYRYYQGTGISGMTFGNLFMAALADLKGGQREAIEETCRLLGVEGHVRPVSYEHASLLATYEDGTEVLGEHHIDISSPQVAHQRIKSLRTIPRITLDHAVKEAILDADLIVLGPGDLYTNSIANLVVKDMPETITKSKAKLVFVMNLMSRAGETYRYQASDFLTDLARYLPPERLDYVLLNQDLTLPADIIAKYADEDSYPVKDDLSDSWQEAVVIRAPLMSTQLHTQEKGDTITRSYARHDSGLLAKELIALIS